MRKFLFLLLAVVVVGWAYGQSSTSPGGSSFGNLASPGPIGGTTPNTGAFSGLSVVPSSTTGANANAANFTLNYFQNVLTGNLFNDPQLSMGYNIGSTANYVTDPFAAGMVVDGNYEVQSNISGSGGTATSISGNILTDTTSGNTSVAWPPGIFVGLTLYNVTQGLSTKITANGSTTITGASLAGWSGTPVYAILDPQERISQRFVSNTGTNRTVTVQQSAFDRAFAVQQASLGTNGVVAISNISSAANALVTVAVTHGLDNTKVVRLSGLSGGTWSKLNGQQVAVISTTSGTLNCPSADATHFCINTNTTGLGTGVFTNATYLAEPAFNGTGGVIMADANQGLRVLAPAWDGEVGGGTGDEGAVCGGAVIAQFLQAQHTLCAYGYGQSNKLTLASGTGAQTTVELYYSGLKDIDLNSYANGLFQVQPIYSNSYSGTTIIMGVKNSGGDPLFAIGPGLENGGIININNVGQTASTPLFYADMAASQTGNIITIRYGGNSYTCCALQIDPTGLYTGAGFISGGGNGTKFSVTTGCASSTSLTGGPTAGKFTCGTTTTAATLTITMGATAPNGWVCNIDDTTSKLHFANTTDTTTTCSATVTITSGDVVKFSAVGY